MVKGRLSLALLVVLLAGLLPAVPVQASTWDRIGGYIRLLRKAGVKPLVAKDCPEGLLGAFHEGRKVLLMCGNNLPDDPAYVWVVLAHESAHVMQFCNGGPLMPPALLNRAMDQARRRSPDAFHELQLYHVSQHQVEAEARVVQAMPPDQVEALFNRHCGSRFEG
ncbi:MAG: hypothetical protein CL862_06540 [Cyanobium sp. NAT70]|nr:hypothetical protein [Cyanobium sp. NAT70]|tara:strand:- start:2827 stop:3321 length:495 start_codon:yes stop_codon:yes gene_type:complete